MGVVGQNKNLATTSSISIINFCFDETWQGKNKSMFETHIRSKLCSTCKRNDEHKKHVVEMQEAHDILESLHTHMENLLEISRFKNYSPISYQRY